MDTMFSQIAWLIPVFPLAAFLLLLAFGRSQRRLGVLTGTVGSFAALVLSILVLIEHMRDGSKYYQSGFKWLDLGRIQINAGFEVTNLTALMLVIVTAVAFLVNVYSAGYMKNDERITVFYSYVALFTFSMLGLVIADNMLTLYIFWELVGVCSFLLVGFWYAKPEAKAAAKKAFIVTRIGDAGLLLGILLLYWYMPDHALDFVHIQNVFEGQTGIIPLGITTLIALLIFVGAVGKSGQFPLHVWLPDAMEGPTPISALIHAATMVAAGVYLVARTFDIFEASQTAMNTVAYIGAFTAIFAATIGVAQNDIKRILAYSTVSQLGYMMMALGLGSLTGGVFHLLTHAFFKALLFLGAGSVIHAVHTQNINEMGGLGSKMRITAWTFGIGSLALSGIPPFSGFWSKDTILTTALYDKPALFVVGVVAAFFTAFYMSRLFFLVFTGKPKGEQKVHESPLTMTIPLIVLAVLAIGSGFIQTPWNNTLGSWLTDGTEVEHGSAGLVMVISAAVGLLGIYLGWLVFVKGTISRDAVSSRAPWLVRLLERKYYIDELYQIIFIKPLRGIGLLLNGIDHYVVDGIVRLTSGSIVLLGKGGTRLQNGQVQTYGLITLFGLIILIAIVALRRFW
ncbi:NADH-quinone oxidoreductase subunit L [Paenibacillus baekrokdamisoli]|uniref:NADH-quinone oxidoreductase subunit L n=1 Tax=Paenibacillus baekrokdamisoli TaxID=1712516 RepID=A0A3G9JIF1_9BACL|nr:NADH-quinone oxidoreductase subunit L [Paenibacillus baekrokdamisoli]MBB3069050.1 NADH-quinone oxidoreductase subunit L [Paenibacillus baekrokdamisoli]BBH23868.1 NADH-quinone oxidoreductase subunit L [Paenibacillus baekrokdamisoli]